MNWSEAWNLLVEGFTMTFYIVFFIAILIFYLIIRGNNSRRGPLFTSQVAYGPGTHEATIVIAGMGRTVRIYANNSSDAMALLEEQYGKNSVISTPRNIGP